MKHIKLVIILILVTCTKINAQWIQTGPELITGNIRIKEINNNLWLQGCIGTYKSNDNGLTWVRTSDLGVNINGIEEIAPNHLIIASNKGIYLSSNNGDNWYSSNQGMQLYDTTTSGCYFIKKLNNGRLITCGKNAYYSDNNGITWIPSNTNIKIVEVIETNNNIIGTKRDSLFQSTNQGQTWVYLNANGINTNAFGGTGLTSIQYANNNCYISNQICTYFYKSTDNGATWSEYITGLPVAFSSIGFLVYIDNKIHLNTYSGVYSFDDMTGLWSLSSINQTELVRLLHKKNNRYFAFPRNYANLHPNIVKSDNIGMTWQNSFSGLNQSSVSKLVQNPNSFIATSNNIAVEFDSINLTFNALTTLADNFCPQNSTPLSTVNSGIIKNNKYYIATLGGIWKKNVGNSIWTQGFNGLPATNASFPNQRPVNDIYLAGTFPNDTLYAATDNGIYMSTDDAASFSLVGGTSGAKMQQFLKYQNILYCAGTKIYKQTNPNNWVQFANFTSASGITGFTATDDYLFVSNSTSLVKYAHVNGLSNFTNITTGSLIAAYSVAAYDTLVFYFSEAGVFKLNTGLLGSATQADVVQIAANLPYYYIPTFPTQTKFYSYLDHGFGMAVFNGKLWLGTKGMSTFYRSLNDFGYNITVGENSNNKTKSDEIGIYPNPAKESINLSGISVQDRNDVLVCVTDITGKLVLQTKINSSVPIDVSQLNAGLYFIELESSKGKQMAKFVKE